MSVALSLLLDVVPFSKGSRIILISRSKKQNIIRKIGTICNIFFPFCTVPPINVWNHIKSWTSQVKNTLALNIFKILRKKGKMISNQKESWIPTWNGRTLRPKAMRKVLTIIPLNFQLSKQLHNYFWTVLWRLLLHVEPLFLGVSWTSLV